MLHEHHFRAMNTSAGAWLWSDDLGAKLYLVEIEQFFARVEAELSRFRPNSGLNRLNAKAGAGPQPVSPLLEIVLAYALAAARTSRGIYNPAILPALRHAGYDRSFEQLVPDRETKPYADDDFDFNLDWRQVALDPAAGAVTLPAGMALDLGGIGKGWTVDQSAEMLGMHGPALVDAGGDMRAVGAPNGEPWPIAVQDPFDEKKDLMILYLADQAVATSSIGGRRWQHNGHTMHHLIDPRTGRPSDSNLFAATVIAGTAMEAELAAKIAIILGLEAGADYLGRRGFSALLVTRAGARHTVGALEQYTVHIEQREDYYHAAESVNAII